MLFNYQNPVILASRSPRRRELLAQLGIRYERVDVEIDESVNASESPIAYVQRMAKEKAETAWASDAIKQIADYQMIPLLAADTSVVLADKILGKPIDLTDAQAMLASLSGTAHQVITSVALKSRFGLALQTSISQVSFAKLSQSDIDNYCQLGEGLDKAGGYAIQGIAAQFICHIQGSYTGVVGLPLYETGLLLTDFCRQGAAVDNHPFNPD